LPAKGAIRLIDNPTPLPSVCVALPVFNGERYVRHAIESALSQDYPDLRVMVVDNASSDATRAIVGKIQDERLRVVCCTEHVPVAQSYDRTSSAARGSFVLFLSADNVLLPGAVPALARALVAHPEAAFAYGQVRYVDDAGVRLKEGPASSRPPTGLVHDVERHCLVHGFNLTIDAVMFRRDLSYLWFDPSASRACDLDLFLRLGQSGAAAIGISREVVVSRQHTDAVSTDRESTWRDTLATLAGHQARSPHPALYGQRIARVLVWLVIYLLQRRERDKALRYLCQFEPRISRHWARFIRILIAIPPAGKVVLLARHVRRVAWRRPRLHGVPRPRHHDGQS
jgi:glycosyltransferase involved in cell wall biosynthesis